MSWPSASLAGSPVAAPVMGDDPIAVAEEEHHLGVPVIGRQRPAVAEHDGLTAAPVLVEDLHAILGRDRAHSSFFHADGLVSSFSMMGCWAAVTSPDRGFSRATAARLSSSNTITFASASQGNICLDHGACAGGPGSVKSAISHRTPKQRGQAAAQFSRRYPASGPGDVARLPGFGAFLQRLLGRAPASDPVSPLIGPSASDGASSCNVGGQAAGMASCTGVPSGRFL